MKKKMITAIAAAVVIGTAIVAAVIAAKKTVNLNDYVTLKIEGVNTLATASLDWDYEGLESAIAKASGKSIDEGDIEDWDSLTEIWSNMENVGEASGNLDLKINKRENLSNGDVVEVASDIDKNIAKKMGVKFKFKKIKQKVKGLAEAQVLSVDELYKDVDVEFTGISPNAGVKITNNSTDPFISTLSFEVKQESDSVHGTSVKKGEKVVVTVDCDQEKAKKAGYVIKDVEKEYIVDGVDAYVQKFDEIDDTTLKKIYDASMDCFDSVLISRDDGIFGASVDIKLDGQLGEVEYSDSVTNYGVEKALFLTRKDESMTYIPANFVLLIIKMDVNGMSNSRGDKLGDYSDCYVGVYTPSVLISKDGETSFENDGVTISNAYLSYEDLYESEMADGTYNAEEVDWDKYEKSLEK